MYVNIQIKNVKNFLNKIKKYRKLVFKLVNNYLEKKYNFLFIEFLY